MPESFLRSLHRRSLRAKRALLRPVHAQRRKSDSLILQDNCTTPDALELVDIPIPSSTPSKSYTLPQQGSTPSKQGVTPSKQGSPVPTRQRLTLTSHIVHISSSLNDAPQSAITSWQSPALSTSADPRTTLHIGVVGVASSGKCALMRRYVLGASCPATVTSHNGRYKKVALVDGRNHVLHIRDAGSTPEIQFSGWAECVLLVFSVHNEASFNLVRSFHSKMSQLRSSASDVPLVLVGTMESEGRTRVVSEVRARKLAAELKRCSYFETNPARGINVDRVFQEACQKIVQQRNAAYASIGGPDNKMAPRASPDDEDCSSSELEAATIKGNEEVTDLARSSGKPNNNNKEHAFLAPATPPPLQLGRAGSAANTSTTSASTTPSRPGGGTTPTPSTTPTSARKARRRSTLFSGGRSSRGASDERGRAEVGSGRTIPIKEGVLYKRSANPLNKEWRKKYVTLCEDGRLTYHPSLHDYMENVHGKEVLLRCVTVKVPGQRPRGSRGLLQSSPAPRVPDPSGRSSAISGRQSSPQPPQQHHPVSAIDDLITRLNIAGGERKGQGSMSAHDTQGSNSDESTAYSSTGESRTAPDNKTANAATVDNKVTETPQAKKRHRRIKSTGLRNTEADDCDGQDFMILSLHNKLWHFEASSGEERDDWVAAIEQQILNSLQGSTSSKGKDADLAEPSALTDLRLQPGNEVCADCGAPEPAWASLNLGVLVCIECSGIHRNLGSHVSRVRSLELDEWPRAHVAVMNAVGNRLANSVWEARLGGVVKPGPNSDRAAKETWVRAKYEARQFAENKPVCEADLTRAVRDGETRVLVQALPTCSEASLSSLLLIACSGGHTALAQLLLWQGADPCTKDSKGLSALALARVNPSSSQALLGLLKTSGCPD